MFDGTGLPKNSSAPFVTEQKAHVDRISSSHTFRQGEESGCLTGVAQAGKEPRGALPDQERRGMAHRGSGPI